MKNPNKIIEKYINKLLENPEVVACLAAGIKYELESDGKSIKFKTINPVKFVRNIKGDIISVIENH
ncbi:MAG: hypothetical protein UW18_C0017G0016 [Microgenomates group bacterium GW2011_GWF1_44_10]|nr:MAG: hypothetical protein UW18_C0017G0016 [Microgenomates group bacterium GW2011_GWF1_44_10]